MIAILKKEIAMIRQERHVLLGYSVVLLLWGIIQPVATFFSISNSESMLDFSNPFLHITNLMTFSAFFLMLSATHSNQTFIGEKQARTLNPILATPVRIEFLILGKWLASVALVATMAMVITTVQWLTYLITSLAVGVSAPFLFPSFLSVIQSFVPLVLLWSVASWFGSFWWLRFETFQTANLVSIPLMIPLLAFEYITVAKNWPISWLIFVLLGVNAVLAILSVRLNHRDRLAQLT